MGRYRRTVSFPNPTRPSPVPKSYHVRSASLPCGRSHPLIPQLRDDINELRAWERAGSGRVCDGLARLKGILDSVDDVIQLPQTQDALSINLVEKLLEDFLRFVDAYGIFQASLLGLKQELSGAQFAIRRKDPSKLGLHIKAQKKIANDIGKLVSTVGSISDLNPIISDINNDDGLVHVIRDVHRVTVSVSSVLFNTIWASFGPGQKPVWAGCGLTRGRTRRKELEEGIIIEEVEEVMEGVERLLGLRKNKREFINEEIMRMGVLKSMQELEDWVIEMERGSERVFRSLITTRVSLLNILTHA